MEKGVEKMNKKELYNKIREKLKCRDQKKLLEALREHLNIKKIEVRKERGSTVIDFSKANLCIKDEKSTFVSEWYYDKKSKEWKEEWNVKIEE